MQECKQKDKEKEFRAQGAELQLGLNQQRIKRLLLF